MPVTPAAPAPAPAPAAAAATAITLDEMTLKEYIKNQM